MLSYQTGIYTYADDFRNFIKWWLFLSQLSNMDISIIISIILLYLVLGSLASPLFDSDLDVISLYSKTMSYRPLIQKQLQNSFYNISIIMYSNDFKF